MTAIINLTQHVATPEQASVGVVEPADKGLVQNLLTFKAIGDAQTQVEARAEALADLAAKSGCTRAMIGGAPYLMGALEGALKARGISAHHAFTARRVVETTGPDGAVTKTAIFVHEGFVPSVPSEIVLAN